MKERERGREREIYIYIERERGEERERYIERGRRKGRRREREEERERGRRVSKAVSSVGRHGMGGRNRPRPKVDRGKKLVSFWFGIAAAAAAAWMSDWMKSTHKSSPRARERESGRGG